MGLSMQGYAALLSGGLVLSLLSPLFWFLMMRNVSDRSDGGWRYYVYGTVHSTMAGGGLIWTVSALVWFGAVSIGFFWCVIAIGLYLAVFVAVTWKADRMVD